MELIHLLSFLILDGLVMGRPIPEGLLPFPVHFPKYEFGYAVNDGFTGDIKSQHEVRHGGNVIGHYSLLDADGRKRIVEYQADDISGFNAVVHRDGQIPSHHGNHAGHPAPHHQFHGSGVVSGPVPIAGGQPPSPPLTRPHHHEAVHYDHHHQHHGEPRPNGHDQPHVAPHHNHPPAPHHHNHPSGPHPPPFAVGHGFPVAHSSAFQNNFFQPYP